MLDRILQLVELAQQRLLVRAFGEVQDVAASIPERPAAKHIGNHGFNARPTEDLPDNAVGNRVFGEAEDQIIHRAPELGETDGLSLKLVTGASQSIALGTIIAWLRQSGRFLGVIVDDVASGVEQDDAEDDGHPEAAEDGAQREDEVAKPAVDGTHEISPSRTKPTNNN